MVTTSQIATCILLPCKRKAPLLYLPASPKQILNRRDLKRRSSPPCVRLGSPPGLNLSLQPAQPSGLFYCPRSAREIALEFRARPWRIFARTELIAAPLRSRTFTVSLWFSRRTQPRTPRAYNGRHLTVAACGGAFEKGFAMLDELHVQNVALIREATFAPARRRIS